MICDNVLEAVGSTPLVRLRRMTGPDDAQVLVKFEAVNVGGSVKTRTALKMVERAEERGELTPDSVIVEPTSGNQGVGLALVAAVKGYAAHETQTLNEVTEARARATSINLSADDLTPERLAQFQRAQAEVRSALGRLIAVSESYPDLKANQNFLELQAQLEGTENRISVARKEFNEVAKTYNVAVRRFPANLVARMFGFGQKPYFESAEGAAAAPQVAF